MSSLPVPLMVWFRDHHGIISSSALRSLGVSDRQRERLIKHHLIVPMFEGVYRLTASPITFEARCAAACMADESLTISCQTSGRLWGIRRCTVDDVHAVTSRTTKPVLHGVTVHRTIDLDHDDSVVRPDGVRLSSPPRMFFEVARHVDDLTLESIGEQILDRRMCSLRTLVDVSRRLARPGRAGSARAMRVLGARPEFQAPADSHLEVVLLSALRAIGLTEFERQPAVRLRSGAVIHPDLGIPSLGFYVEVDHHTWHGGREAVDYDKSRDRQLRLTGAVVERVTDRQITQRLADVVSELFDLVSQRRISFGADTPESGV